MHRRHCMFLLYFLSSKKHHNLLNFQDFILFFFLFLCFQEIFLQIQVVVLMLIPGFYKHESERRDIPVDKDAVREEVFQFFFAVGVFGVHLSAKSHLKYLKSETLKRIQLIFCFHVVVFVFMSIIIAFIQNFYFFSLLRTC